MVNEMVAKLTSECWDKCITGTPGNKFSSSESNCLSNCAHRYLEMSMLIMKRLMKARGRSRFANMMVLKRDWVEGFELLSCANGEGRTCEDTANRSGVASWFLWVFWIGFDAGFW
ncbi:hypothetical protein V8G54_012374 [Vigna mungo]|uniref:Mitochondrial import inner membrane translocase subunit n=1 Tax=Vigna mungo TaxID=3915 RepID=A0AAQ3S3B2_VIGMU